jgi:carbamoyl-phosphate synthase large subunit
MGSQQVNILMTGGGAPGAAGIIRCLQQEPTFKVFAADANPNAVGKHLVDDFKVIPPASDPAFINSVLSICRENNVHVVMPLVTRELFHFAKHKKDFEFAGAHVLVATYDSLEIANDKSKLYQFLEWRGLELPAFRVVETVSQFEGAVRDLGYPSKTVCFKPSLSNGSRGFRIISNSVDKHHLLFNEKPTAVYMSFEEAVSILSSQKFPELLVSEYLPGEEYSVDCLAKNGETLIAVPRSRKKMINGISVEGEFINNDEIIQYCRRIISEVKLHGNIGIQLKQSEKGKFLLLEINPRVQGTICSGLGAGINLPVLAVKQELGMNITEDELNVKWGTKFSRYWSEVFF